MYTFFWATLYVCLRVHRRKTGCHSWAWCLVDRNWKRVSFVRKSAIVACRIVGWSGRAEVGLSSKRNTGIILHLQRQISVSRKRQGNADTGKTSEECRTKYLRICKCRVFSLKFNSRIRSNYRV